MTKSCSVHFLQCYLILPLLVLLLLPLQLWSDFWYIFDKVIRSVVNASFFLLRHLREIETYLPLWDIEKLNFAVGLLQLSLHMAGSELSGANAGSPKCFGPLADQHKKMGAHSSFLCSLHWLPVPFPTNFNILLIVYKCLNSLAPQFLSELL